MIWKHANEATRCDRLYLSGRNLSAASHSFVPTVALAALLLSSSTAVSSELDVWKIGLGRALITPTEPVLLSGYGGRDRPFESVDTDLFVKSLAIEDPFGHLAVLVTLDVECMRDHTAEPLLERLGQETGLEASQILLNFSHTHAAPFLSLDPSTTDYGSTPETAAKTVAHTQWLLDQVVSAVQQSLAQRSQARLSFGMGVAPFVMNRREFTTSGVKIGKNPRAFVDRSVPVLRVDDLTGNPRAVVFGCACHNTTLPGENLAVSGDYAGHAQEYLEDQYPGLQAMFMTGCGADANPYPRGTLELAKLHGRTLGLEVGRFLSEARTPAPTPNADRRRSDASLTSVNGPLSTVREQVELPLRQWDSLQAARDESIGTDTWKVYHAKRMLELAVSGWEMPQVYRCPLAVWQFGTDLTLVGLSGEIVAGYVPLIEEQLGPQGLWMAAYCNEQFGYVPTARVIQEGGYETRGLEDGKVGQFAPEVERVLVSNTVRLAERARRAATEDHSSSQR